MSKKACAIVYMGQVAIRCACGETMILPPGAAAMSPRNCENALLDMYNAHKKERKI